MLSPIEIILIVFVIMLMFGASRLPKMGRSLGQGIRGFRHELSDGLRDDEEGKLEERSERGAATPRAAGRP